jgi:hypothetical protein
MEIEYKIWHNRLLAFSNKINGRLNIVKNPSVGYGGDYLTAQICIDKISIIQNVVKLNTLIHPSFMEFEYKFKNNKKLYLSISGRDFLDKLFSGQIKTGNKNFDKKYSIKSSNKALALNMFSDNKVQEYFLSNRLMVFNIQTTKGETIVKLKLMENRLYSIEKMQKALSFFRYVIKFIEQIKH